MSHTKIDLHFSLVYKIVLAELHYDIDYENERTNRIEIIHCALSRVSQVLFAHFLNVAFFDLPVCSCFALLGIN